MKIVPILTFTTDFGIADTYVAQMKGAALAVHPGLTLVDLTHEVPPHDVAAGAHALRLGCRPFPAGTVHVAVVDPGVGTDRRAVAVRTARFVFVAPDNGLLTRVLDEDPPEAAHLVSNPRYRGKTVSRTFEGRDVFAPAAAWISRGVALSELGPPVDDLVRLPSPAAAGRKEWFPVRVIAVDRFGNVTLELTREQVEPLLSRTSGVRVRTAAGEITRFLETYGEAPEGEPFLLWDSGGMLEIAVRRGSAAALLGLVPGGRVEVLAG